MGMINTILNIFLSKEENNKSEFIYYKIVNFNEKKNKFLFQCINTKATFLLSLTEIIDDEDILYGLHPTQACYLGIEYITFIKLKKQQNELPNKKRAFILSGSRYGNLVLRHQDRKNNICFVDVRTNKNFLMDPRDVALSEELIIQFDAIQAFHIGILTGLKMSSSIGELYRNKHAKPILTLVR